MPDSFARQHRLATLFAQAHDEDAAFEALKDHQGYPLSICRHGAIGEPVTAASILIRLRRGEMLICRGNLRRIIRAALSSAQSERNPLIERQWRPECGRPHQGCAASV